MYPFPGHGYFQRILVGEWYVGILVHPAVFLEKGLREAIRQDDGPYLVSVGLKKDLFVLREEEKPGDEDDIRIQGKVAVDGLGLVGKTGLTLDRLGKNLIFELDEVVAKRERLDELIDVDVATHDLLS